MIQCIAPPQSLQTAEFISEPAIFFAHCEGIAFTFIGQDVLEVRPGELWMFCHFGRKPTEFGAADTNYRQPPMLQSCDGGRSWQPRPSMALPWKIDGYLSDGGVSVLRLPAGRLIFISHRFGSRHMQSGSHGSPAISSSDDGGESWSPARLMDHDDGIVYVMNQRLIRLDGGRLVLPVAMRDEMISADHYHEGADPTVSGCYVSDDDGASWRLANGRVRDETKRGAQEPCVAQVGPNRLVMLFRSGRGCHQTCFSGDGGETWTAPQDTALSAACSPLTLSTMEDGRLIVVYNHAEPQYTESYYPRNPLVYAISSDGGLSWCEPVLIDDTPGQQLIYPSITPTSEGLLIVYCAAFAPPDGSFDFPPDAWKAGGGKSCVISYPR